MSKIKSVSQFEDNIWGEATPIGADASNIDVEMSDSSTKDLQTVLGDIPSAAAPIQSQINAKVTASGGNIGNTTVSSGIQNFDSSSSETSTELLDASVRVTNATEVTSSMWTKFNRFRKRVDNKFKDVFLSSVEDVASPSLTKTYSQSALNDYFANVVGYATAADLPDASSSIANQLSTLNSNIINTLIAPKSFGSAVSIVSYSTSDNPYTIPSHGIVTANLYYANSNVIAIIVGGVEVIRLSNNGGAPNDASGNAASCPVYKGQKAIVQRGGPNATSCTAYFRPYVYE